MFKVNIYNKVKLFRSVRKYYKLIQKKVKLNYFKKGYVLYRLYKYQVS